ncbi:hypothetical protein [Shimia sp.]|uniref:hypothetical protein n=1 Tax=Shimia sp. TaxID=1954381 RepID=UPI0032969999
MVFKDIAFSLCAASGVLALSLTAGSVLTPFSSPDAPDVGVEMAQTNGMNRRDDRRDDRQDRRGGRQDCRQEEGAVGADKRDCKQDNRQGESDEPATQTNEGN